MLERVRRIIREYNMIEPGELVVVGVSGGPDSMALLHCLNRIAGEFQFRLHVVHVNHGLRPEAGEEAEFVVNFAGELGISGVVRKLNGDLLKEGSLQELAREARRKVFFAECKATGATKIALGHNANDQAETVLQRLLRGGGTGGLGGIHPVREQIIRPFLFVRREEIERYLAEQSIEYRVDASNYQPVYLRNKIRLELIPKLQAGYNPRIVEALGKTALVLQEDDAYLNKIAAERCAELMVRVENNFFLPNEVFSLPKPLSTRILRQTFALLVGDPRGLEYDHVSRTLSFAQTGRSGGCLQLPHGVRAYKEQEGLLLCPGVLTRPRIEEQPLNIPGETREPGLRIVIRARLVDNPSFFPLPEGAWSIVLNYEQLRLPLSVRGRRPGDKILSCGSCRKLKEIFSERRIPIRLRESSLLLAQGDEVLWVPGLVRSDKARVLPNTFRVLELVASKY